MAMPADTSMSGAAPVGYRNSRQVCQEQRTTAAGGLVGAGLRARPAGPRSKPVSSHPVPKATGGNQKGRHKGVGKRYLDENEGAAAATGVGGEAPALDALSPAPYPVSFNRMLKNSLIV